MATTAKRGDSYKITVSCGYDISGKQLRKHMTWTPASGMTTRQIEKELERQAVLFEEKCRTGQVLDGSTRFAEFIDCWMTDYAEKHLRPTTVAGYRGMLRRILPALGHLRLDKLQPHQLNTFYRSLEEPGARQNRLFRLKVDLDALLRERGMTHVALARESGVREEKISGLVKGGNLSGQNAWKLANALSMPVETIFEPVTSNGCLSGNTVLHYHRFLSSVLSTAVRWQVIFANPCARVTPPKIARKEARYLDQDEALALLKALRSAPKQYRVMVTLLLYTGLRRGELCGLEWEDVDFGKGLLTIRRSSLYLPGRGIFTDHTKNTTSQRVLKLPADALVLLRRYRAHQRKRRLQLGDQWQDCGRLFTTWCGLPIHPDTFSKWFSTFVRTRDLPPISAHSLRHTNATLLIAAGVNLKTVSSHLGHTNVVTTGNIYVHAIQSAEAAAAEALQDILKNPPKKRA